MNTITITKADITKLHTDAIVNAANSHLAMGGGVCGAIFRAAGVHELEKACDAIGYCATGSAVLTPGFRCKADYIVHAVGPVYQGGHHNERKYLYSAYISALNTAYDHGCKTIAFPLISAGIYGYPLNEAWKTALQACMDFPHHMDITFAVLDDNIKAVGEQTLKQETARHG